MIQEWESIVHADERRALFGSKQALWRGRFVAPDDLLEHLEHVSYTDLELWKAIADWQRSWDRVMPAAQDTSPQQYLSDLLSTLNGMSRADIKHYYSDVQIADLRALTDLVGADVSLCSVVPQSP